MFAIVSIETFKINLIVTNHSNIDWSTKEIENNEDIIELDFLFTEYINILDINTNRYRVIGVSDLDGSKHRLLIGKKIYVILHKTLIK